MGRLVLVRHGEAEGNRSHTFIGQTDVPLTDLGRAQAIAVAGRLADASIDRIVSSDLSRAHDTGRAVAERLGLSIEIDARVREIHNGEWAGLRPQEIDAGWPSLWERYRGGEDVPRPGGERWADVRARVLEAMTHWLAQDGTTLITSHGGPVLITAHWAAGLDVTGNVFRGPLGGVLNTSITVVDPGPRLTAFNDIGHLTAFAGHEEPDAPVI